MSGCTAKYVPSHASVEKFDSCLAEERQKHECKQK